ncbi:MAG: hypothetical protein RLO08_18970 [Parvibaculaceae bacterium]
MRSLIWNISAVVAIVVSAVAFEAGFVAPRDAFFIAFSVLAIYTGNQLLARENQPLGEALASIFTKPGSHGSSVSYLSGLVVAGLGTLVVAHTLTFI